MKSRFATKTMPYLTPEELIDIAGVDEYWGNMTRAAMRRLRKKAKDQQTIDFLESHLEEDALEIV